MGKEGNMAAQSLPDRVPESTPKARRPKPARGKAFGILNPYGDFWTYQTFETERAARDYVARFWGQRCFRHTSYDHRKFKVIPVRVTVSALGVHSGTRAGDSGTPSNPRAQS